VGPSSAIVWFFAHGNKLAHDGCRGQAKAVGWLCQDRRESAGGGGTIARSSAEKRPSNPADTGQHRGLADRAPRWTRPAVERRSMSPKWMTTPIRAGASRRREYVRLSGSDGCRLRRFLETALAKCFRTCRHCLRKRSRRQKSCARASPMRTLCCTWRIASPMQGGSRAGTATKFYAEGVTPAVARLYEAINAERVAVTAALGASVPTLAD
jgi:hypothetical protein